MTTFKPAEPLFPIFLKLRGRRVLLVGAGRVASEKLRHLLDAGADVTVVAPELGNGVGSVVSDSSRTASVRYHRRPFVPADLDDVWFVVAAAPPEVNREVATAAEERRVFVNAVDDVQSASAYAGGVVRRGGVTLALSTDGDAPALAGLLREALEMLLPDELDQWMACARQARRQWLAANVPMADRRPLLLDALVRLYGTRGPVPRAITWGTGPFVPRAITRGTGPLVSIVGAGPGDPELLTRKAAMRLAKADLVLYDALVDPETLELAPRAQRVFVGKRAGRPAVRQEFIHRMLIRAARRGLRVVRLKGGDPFVLGRGGEEALALASAGVPFEVVPGVSAAVAAPALAGIPATHRAIASAVVVVSGHADSSYAPIVDSLAPHSATLVVLMGLMHCGAIASRLISRGWNTATPAAVLLAASTARADMWTSTLGRLALEAVEVEDDRPGTIVIGEVVRLSAVIGPAMSAVACGVSDVPEAVQVGRRAL